MKTLVPPCFVSALDKGTYFQASSPCLWHFPIAIGPALGVAWPISVPFLSFSELFFYRPEQGGRSMDCGWTSR